MISSICLLAGYSKRMGQKKQHLKIGKKSFLERIIDNLKQHKQYFTQLFFVGQQDDKKSQLIVEKAGGRWVTNKTPERGPLSSIKLAIELADDKNAIMLWPVDHPLIESETISILCEHHLANPEKIIVPSINFRRGHPGIFPGSMQDDFFEIPENEGARKLLQLHPDKIIHVVTEDEWVRKNINTPELLEEAVSKLKE
ncbi:MAG: nucleotidyltransferase family protein [Candidatus Rifleibacteriota bacterium]